MLRVHTIHGVHREIGCMDALPITPHIIEYWVAGRGGVYLREIKGKDQIQQRNPSVSLNMERRCQVFIIHLLPLGSLPFDL